MNILGYVDPLSGAPGSTIELKVSANADYDLNLVRLLHGDDSVGGPGFVEEYVPSDIEGRYRGRGQSLDAGSYAVVTNQKPFPNAPDITFSLWVWPSLVCREPRVVMDLQFLNDTRLTLLLSGDGRFLLQRTGAGFGPEGVESDVTVEQKCWYFVLAGLSRQERRLTLDCVPLATRRHLWRTSRELRAAGEPEACQVGRVTIGACLTPVAGRQLPNMCFNGKIENPVIFARALSPREALAASGPWSAANGDRSVLAAWDFSTGFDSSEICDASGHGHHGLVVNGPTRAVTGRTWNGRECDFRREPRQYAAIYFHDDDLEDASWSTDVAFRLPSLTSGIYAFKLAAANGDEDYVPFVVRPPQRARTADAAFIVPTLSYLAYANDHEAAASPESALSFAGVSDIRGSLRHQDHFMINHRLLSLYDRHTDGTGVCYSSWRRPLLTVRPKYLKPIIQSAHQFNADLSLLHFLTVHNFRTDFLTDHDLHREGLEALKGYRVVLTGSHPEYYSAGMLDAMEGYLASGGRLMYLGGNGFYWVTSVSEEKPHVIEVRRGHSGTRAWSSAPGEEHHSTSGERGGLWRHRGRFPQRLVGVGFSAQGGAKGEAFRRTTASRDARGRVYLRGSWF